jgi:hypothetical protein
VISRTLCPVVVAQNLRTIDIWAQERDPRCMRRTAVVMLVACSAPTPPPVTPTNERRVADKPAGDADDDGLPADRDACPDQPEDYDVFADEDGCPDLDNDNDGVPDLEDPCAYEAGAHGGCVTECTSFITKIDDCILTPQVDIDAHGVPDQARLDEIVKLTHDNPHVQAFEILGPRPELVARPLRARLPRHEIEEQRRDIAIDHAVYVRITKQRIREGRFAEVECSSFGAVYKPRRPANCTR